MAIHPAMFSAEARVPDALKPELKWQWDLIKNSIGQPEITEVMKQIEAGENQEVLTDTVDLLFKRLAEHFHHQFSKSHYPDIPTDYAYYVTLNENFQEVSMKIKDLFTKAWLSGRSRIVMNEKAITMVPSPSEKDSYSDLKELSLNYNQISWIPQNWFDHFTQIERLELTHNRLKTIPDSIRGLKNLRFLCLDKNKIEKIPESIGELSQLFSLTLSENNIETLPESIGNLTNLRSLHLSKNQLRILPQSMQNLQIDDFPLIECNRNYNKVLRLFFGIFKDNKLTEDMDSHDLPCLLSKMKTFREYACRSQFAKLCQMVATEEDAKIQSAFESLCDRDKNRIYQCIRELNEILDGPQMNPLWSKQHKFEDMDRFYHAVAYAIWKKYEQLHRNDDVFRKIYELANRPVTSRPIQWGKEHAFDHILRLVDAMDGL
jgi:hypothetical protein